MKNFYIPPRFITLFIFVSILLFIFGTFLSFFLWLIFFFLIVLAFRKIPIDYKDFLGLDKKILYSPVHGRVKKINAEKGEITLKIPFWGPFGIFFPAPGEVLSAEEKLEKRGPFTKLNFKTKFRITEDQEIAMRVESWYLLIGPRMWIVAGDRGRLAANMGMIPFGGKVYMSLPEGSKLKVKKGSRVQVGRSIIAGLKDKHE